MDEAGPVREVEGQDQVPDPGLQGPLDAVEHIGGRGEAAIAGARLEHDGDLPLPGQGQELREFGSPGRGVVPGTVLEEGAVREFQPFGREIEAVIEPGQKSQAGRLPRQGPPAGGKPFEVFAVRHGPFDDLRRDGFRVLELGFQELQDAAAGVGPQVRHDPDGILSAQPEWADGDFFRRATGITEKVLRVRGQDLRAPGRPAGSAPIEPGDPAADRYLELGLLGQGHADRVPDPVLEQAPDADGGLDAPVLPVPRLRHSQVEGIVHPRFLHARGQQPVGRDHDLGVRGFHGKDDVAEPVLLADAHELERGLHHAFRRVPVAVHDAVGKRPVVGADPQGPAELLQLEHEGREALLDPFQLLPVGLVGVFHDLEGLGIHVVAGVHPDLLHVFGRLHGGGRQEMDVGDDGDPDSPGEQLAADIFKVLRVLDGRGGDADDLAAGPDQAFGLGDRPRRVERAGGGHGLEADGVIPPPTSPTITSRVLRLE